MIRNIYFLLGSLAIISFIGAIFLEILGLVSFALLGIVFYVALFILVFWLIVTTCAHFGLFSWRFKLARPLKPLLFIIVPAFAAILSLHLFMPPAKLDSPTSVAEQLEYMFDTDQADRMSNRIFAWSSRDRARREQVLAYNEQGLIVKPKSKFHAAMILQHGTETKHYELAHVLATEAAKGGVAEAHWLKKATYDRWQLSLGQPQKYGTQSTAIFSPFGISFENE